MTISDNPRNQHHRHCHLQTEKRLANYHLQQLPRNLFCYPSEGEDEILVHSYPR